MGISLKEEGEKAAQQGGGYRCGKPDSNSKTRKETRGRGGERWEGTSESQDEKTILHTQGEVTRKKKKI